ncbi:MAG TPA: peptidase M28 family protein, partial [Calditrichia bacterium]|nr:peptidase M28 family protein [Calditrichia bacterium]
MRPFLLMFLLIFTMAGFPQEADSGNEDAKMVQKIFEECLVSGDTYHLLEHLCTEIGPRLSGSQGAADAVAWTRQVMSDYGFDRVFLQEVMVPHWERGAAESAVINPSKSGEKTELRMLAIGGSVPTPASGITAEIIEVMSLDDLEGLGEKAIKGKIVFFNRPFDQKVISTGAGYGGAV